MDTEYMELGQTPQYMRLREENKVYLLPYFIFSMYLSLLPHILLIYFIYCIHTHTYTHECKLHEGRNFVLLCLVHCCIPSA